MTDQVDEIKSKTDIVAIIGEHITLKKAGRNYKALCPFHGEKTPSFMVSPELQMYKCFGCSESGDVFTFLEKAEGMDFREALKYLADRAGVKLVSFHPSEESEREKIIKINELASRFYQYVLLEHPSGKVALNYLIEKRGLTPGTIKTFHLGYSPDVIGALKKFLVDKKKFSMTDLEKAGLGFPKGGTFVDKFRGRVIFPLSDHRDNILGFAGRIIPGLAKTELAKYINSPETPAYHKSKLLFGLNLTKGDIKTAGSVVVVEGELDMISSWQNGVKNVVAIKGSALTDEQVRLLWRFCQKIILALDSDFAGDKASRSGIVIAQNQGFEVKVARLGKYKDPDEAARGNIDYYKKALSEAVGVWDFIIDSVFSRNDPASGEGKAKISREIVPVLSSVADKIVQAHYVKVVADKLGVSPDSVMEQMMSIAKQEKGPKPFEEVIAADKPKERQQLLEERLLALAFYSDPKFLLADKIRPLVLAPLPKRVLEEYRKSSEGGKKFNLSEFSKNLPKELLQGFAEAVLESSEKAEGNPDDISLELALVVHELKILKLKRELGTLGDKIRKEEDAGEKQKLKESQKKFGELSLKLSKLEDARKQGIILKEE